MRIEYDIKLGFKNVMFRPKAINSKSQSQVILERTIMASQSIKQTRKKYTD